MAKFLLHISHMQQFQEWLDKMAIKYRPGRGSEYQVLQVKNPTGPEWFAIYSRDSNQEYYTNDKRLDNLILTFLRNIENGNQ